MPKETMTRTIELTTEDVEEALLKHFNLESGEIYFRVEPVEDPDDWRAEMPISYKLVKVTIKTEG